MSPAALLLLTDGRLPAGGHAHSGGVESAVGRDLVRDVPSLQAFLDHRLHTAGVTAAGLAAAACAGWSPEELDAEADARIATPGLREASRSQGRAMLRAVSTAWPSAAYAAAGARPHQPVVLGLAAAAAGCRPVDAALAAAYSSVTGPASAAIRLLGFDPLAVHVTLADLAPEVDQVAAAAASDVAQGRLPAAASPLLDILAARHTASACLGQVTLFAS